MSQLHIVEKEEDDLPKGWIESLSFCPVKSCHGVSTSELGILTDGPRYDREFVIADEKGQFLTQRQHAVMATIMVERTPEFLKLTRGKHSITLAKELEQGNEREVTVWGQGVLGLDMGDAAAEFLTDILGKSVRLYRYQKEKPRVIAKDPTPAFETRFTDQGQVLLILEESRRALSQHISEDVPADRFRFNVHVSGFPAWSEETWKRVKIGGVEFEVFKKTSRCPIITIDQDTGDKKSAQSLVALKNELKGPQPKANFGIYLRVTRPGTIRLIDRVTVLEAEPVEVSP